MWTPKQNNQTNHHVRQRRFGTASYSSSKCVQKSGSKWHDVPLTVRLASHWVRQGLWLTISRGVLCLMLRPFSSIFSRRSELRRHVTEPRTRASVCTTYFFCKTQTETVPVFWAWFTRDASNAAGVTGQWASSVSVGGGIECGAGSSFQQLRDDSSQCKLRRSAHCLTR